MHPHPEFKSFIDRTIASQSASATVELRPIPEFGPEYQGYRISGSTVAACRTAIDRIVNEAQADPFFKESVFVESPPGFHGTGARFEWMGYTRIGKPVRAHA